MGRCFVMQPFDGGPFDSRYEDVFVPAIKDAGLEPYRVDRDPNVTIPIDEIEQGIRSAEVCLAEISLDKPNIWYELGFAIAAQKEVVLVCIEDRRTTFPFDVQHRHIIRYRIESVRDFDAVKAKVTTRLKAILEKEAKIGMTSEMSPIKPVQGLKQHEFSCLLCIAESVDGPDMVLTSYSIRNDMERHGYTQIATTMALNSLERQNMISRGVEEDINGNKCYIYSITAQGLEWLEENQDRIILKTSTAKPLPHADDDLDETDPFADE